MPHPSNADSPAAPSPQGLPTTITVDGIRYTLTRHARETGDLRKITEAEVEQAIANWTARGVCVDSKGNWTRTYWGFPPGKTMLMLKVVISLDSDEIITLQYNKSAVKRLAGHNISWFQQRCRSFEVRDES